LSERKANKKREAPGANHEAPTLHEAGPMDVSLLQSLVKLMQANDLNMIELRDGEKRVVLQRGAAGVPVVTAVPTYAPVANSAPLPPAAAANGSEDSSLKMLEIKSPMVGTFYTAPSPDAKPFVNVGSAVSEETDVCVIEAMKVFNNVKAECKGTIARILVNNGQAVEFNQVLFLVKP
jgi:acetyl-CoA carboxylase biotin carboxyl carrier protein